MRFRTKSSVGPTAIIALLLSTFFLLSCATRIQTEEDSFNPSGDSATQTSQSSLILQGKVVAILDGDTIIVLDTNKESFKVRFKGIDAPEKSQAFGQQAKENLSSLIFSRNVSVQWQECDRYQRILGKIQFNDQDIGLKMIETGYAWHYKRFQESQHPSDRISYAEAENRSRQQKIGLWQDPNPIPPWDYRNTHSLKLDSTSFPVSNLKTMNNNGHSKDPGNPDPTAQSDDERVNLTLRDMEETAHYQGLTDLALIATVLENEQLSVDPRVYELMSRIYPDWPNEDYRSLPTLPRFISIALPYQVAYDVANFSRCRCSDSSDKNTATVS